LVYSIVDFYRALIGGYNMSKLNQKMNLFFKIALPLVFSFVAKAEDNSASAKIQNHDDLYNFSLLPNQSNRLSDDNIQNVANLINYISTRVENTKCQIVASVQNKSDKRTLVIEATRPGRYYGETKTEVRFGADENIPFAFKTTGNEVLTINALKYDRYTSAFINGEHIEGAVEIMDPSSRVLVMHYSGKIDAQVGPAEHPFYECF
jgi:hypothetical protein